MQESSCKSNYFILSCSVFEIKRPKLISAVCVSLEFIFLLCVSSELATSLWEIWLRLSSQSVLSLFLHQSSKKYHEPWTARTSLTVSASVIIRNTCRNTSNAFLSLQAFLSIQNNFWRSFTSKIPHFISCSNTLFVAACYILIWDASDIRARGLCLLI